MSVSKLCTGRLLQPSPLPSQCPVQPNHCHPAKPAAIVCSSGLLSTVRPCGVSAHGAAWLLLFTGVKQFTGRSSGPRRGPRSHPALTTAHSTATGQQHGPALVKQHAQLKHDCTRACQSPTLHIPSKNGKTCFMDSACSMRLLLETHVCSLAAHCTGHWPLVPHKPWMHATCMDLVLA